MLLIDGVYSGFIVGAFPTAAMVFATCTLTYVKVGERTEAGLQNLAAGLILGAVACELLPIMRDDDDNAGKIYGNFSVSDVGITIGFVIGLSTIYGIEYLTHLMEKMSNDKREEVSNHHHGNYEQLHTDDIDESDTTIEKASTLKSSLIPNQFQDEFYDDPSNPHTPELVKDLENVQFDETHVEFASKAIMTNPAHKKHIQEHLTEMLESIRFMQERGIALTNHTLSVREVESIAENIDERIHSLQYMLDHCRRLIQGSETGDVFIKHHNNSFHPSSSFSWMMSEEKVNIIRKGLFNLRSTAEHLLEHLQEPVITKETLQEIRIHMDHMDRQISAFHESIETVASKWTRILPKIDTFEGDVLPVGLILAVCMDCLVDGVLIGISSTVSVKAGLILSCANCFEMSFLGMAYASRLVKCTGSSATARMLALYGPPLIMLAASGIASIIGAAVHSMPLVFISMVSFGAVALLFLVCNELVIEAREAQGDDEKWYISIMLFLGVFAVLILDYLL